MVAAPEFCSWWGHDSSPSRHEGSEQCLGQLPVSLQKPLYLSFWDGRGGEDVESGGNEGQDGRGVAGDGG